MDYSKYMSLLATAKHLRREPSELRAAFSDDADPSGPLVVELPAPFRDVLGQLWWDADDIRKLQPRQY